MAFLYAKHERLYQLHFKMSHKILNRIFQGQDKKRRDSLSYHEYF